MVIRLNFKSELYLVNISQMHLWSSVVKNFHSVDVLLRQEVIQGTNVLANFNEAATISLQLKII